MECGTKRISSDASCVVCVLCIPYYAPSAEHMQCVTIVKIKNSILCCIATENLSSDAYTLNLKKKNVKFVKSNQHICVSYSLHMCFNTLYLSAAGM